MHLASLRRIGISFNTDERWPTDVFGGVIQRVIGRTEVPKDES